MEEYIQIAIRFIDFATRDKITTNIIGAVAIAGCLILWKFSLKIGGGFRAEEPSGLPILDAPFRASNWVILLLFLGVGAWLVYRVLFE